MQMGLAATFLWAGSAMPAGAYAPHTNLPTLAEISTWEIKTVTALQQACHNPGGGYSDDHTIYFKVDDSQSALAIPIEYFMANYDPVAQKIDLPENAPRVLCPV